MPSHQRLLWSALLSIAFLFATQRAEAQCNWYTITVTDGLGAPEVTWSLIDQLGVEWAAGAAPWTGDICLPDGCYTLLMYDSNSDGWQDINWFIEDWIGEFDWDTNLPDGPHGTDGFVLGTGQPCDPVVIGSTCPPGTSTLQFIVTAGTAPAQVSWNIGLNGTPVFAGGANYNDTVCLQTGCYDLIMLDAGSNGWQGATYTLKYFGGATLYTGTLAAGATDTVTFSIGGANCTVPGGGGGGGACSNVGNPTGDCPTVLCACDPFTFPITPSGFGSIDEIPTPGSVSNPAFGGLVPAPWGGNDFGCLYAGELNSSWIMFTIGTSGSLGFSFGAGGQQVGFYDWAMWAYNGPTTCSQIANNAQPPVRCVWDAAPWGGAGLANVLPPGGDPGNYGPELPVLAGQRFIICMSNWSYVTADVTLDFFGTATVICGNVLPIELVAFTAEVAGNDALVRWTTATERNNDHFNVQRSTDAETWTTVGTVQGAGDSQELRHYDLLDPTPPAGVDYYRLQQVDTDGSVSYSQTEAVQFSTSGVLRAWPVPNQGAFQVSGCSAPPIVLDALGRVVEVQVSTGTAAEVFEVHIVHPTPGIYLLLDSTSGACIGKVLVTD